MRRKYAWLAALLPFLFLPLSLVATESPPAFDVWLQHLNTQAQSEGISGPTVNAALHDVRFLPWVIEADRRQPEFKKTLAEYLAGALSKQRIKQGRRMLRENRDLLQQISHKYRVQPHYLVALWGIESNYGRNTGKVPILSALATLAFDARRSDYFRRELLNALRILDSGKLTKDQLLGSWAGAMGQLQFMPSTFLANAVDGNADGRIDLWQTREDYLASAANYLHNAGWQWNYRWGRKVKLPATFDNNLVGLEHRLSLRKWQQLGVRLSSGQNLPQDDISAAIVMPDVKTGQAFLVYQNYWVLMRWNKAHSFALAVGELADRVAAGGQ